jgi:alpha-L-fucosidase
MKFIFSLHHQWLYAWYTTMDSTTDAVHADYEDLYGPRVPASYFKMANAKPEQLPDAKFNKRWLSRAIEAVDKYQPDLVWFDNKLHILQDKTKTDFLSHYYNKGLEWGRDVVATYKHEEFPKGAGILDLERSRMAEKMDFPWLTDDSIDWKAWCHIDDPDYKSPNRLIDFLVDVVSKNGCLLLNITPKANGEIPEAVKERLLEMGKWLEVNGEAIYGTRPWRIYGEGPMKIVEGHLSEKENVDATAEEIRYTTKDDMLYVIALGWPESGKLVINSLGDHAAKITSISLLGSDSELKWSVENEKLIIKLPTYKPNEYAYTFKLESEEI